MTTRNFRGMPPNYWGRTSVVAGEHDESNLVVTMHQAGVMSGHITVDLDPNRETPTTPPAVTAHLEPAAGNPALGRPGFNSRPDRASADFTLDGLLPGEYVLRLGSTWIARSIKWNGRDYTDSTFNAAETQDFSGVEIVATNAGAILTGTVHDASGGVAPGTRVLIFPLEPALRLNQGFSPPRIKSIISASNGTYRISALPGGSYFAIALARSPETGWLDPEFLATVETLATRLSVGWSETKSMDLNVR